MKLCPSEALVQVRLTHLNLWSNLSYSSRLHLQRAAFFENLNYHKIGGHSTIIFFRIYSKNTSNLLRNISKKSFRIGLKTWKLGNSYFDAFNVTTSLFWRRKEESARKGVKDKLYLPPLFQFFTFSDGTPFDINENKL